MARARKNRKRRRRSSRSKGQSVSTISFYVFLCFAVTFIVSIYVSQTGLLMKTEQYQQLAKTARAEKIVSKILSAAAKYGVILKTISTSPALNDALKKGQWDKIKLLEKNLLEPFPDALLVSVLPYGYDQLDKKTKPNISYACLDLIHKAEKSNNQSVIEVHSIKTEDKHVGIIQPIFDTKTKKIIGIIRLALNVNVLDKWLSSAGQQNYVELNQQVKNKQKIKLASFGKTGYKKDSASATVQIPGTSWNLNVWLPIESAPSIFNWLTLSVMFFSVLVAGLMVYSLNHSLSRTIRIDLDNYMQLVAAVAKGKKNHEYKLILKEFKQAALNVDNIAVGNAMERERDNDADSMSMNSVQDSDFLGIDPLYMSQDAMSVEELDDVDINKLNETTAASKVSPAADSAASFAALDKHEEPEKIPKNIFKAYDIRGIVGTSLTPAIVELIGRAIGSEAHAREQTKIVFARDGRLSGPELGSALVKGLRSTGIDVIDIGMVPTPLLYFVATKGTNGTGVMLTGSHNPAEYNGIKIMIAGTTLSSDAIQALRQRIVAAEFVSGDGKYETAKIIDNYISTITNDVKLNRKLKIVIDCGNGVAGVVAPALYRAMGCDVVELFCDVDGKFPNHHPDPSQPKNLVQLIEAVKLQKADLGLAFDGDGDRLGVVSGDGKVIWPDRLMMLFAADVLTRHRGAKIIFDVKCTNNLTRAIWEKGGEPLMWKTGHSYMKAKLKESGALLAGEMSGHIFFQERWFGFDDGLYSGARLLEILSKDVRQAKVIFANLPDMVNTPELHLKMREGEHFTFMDKLMDSADFGSANVIMIDGIRADYEDGWGLVRASNTTPTLVFRFEGKNAASMKRIQEQFKLQLKVIDANLKLPF